MAKFKKGKAKAKVPKKYTTDWDFNKDCTYTGQKEDYATWQAYVDMPKEKGASCKRGA